MERKIKLRRRRKNDTKFRISSNLCRKLRYEVEKRLSAENPLDFTAANFLVWLSKKQQIIRGEYHIDHIIPISKFDLRCNKQKLEANSPYNVRWLKSELNLKKNDSLPASSEIQSHYDLVGEWVKENHTLKTISILYGA